MSGANNGGYRPRGDGPIGPPPDCDSAVRPPAGSVQAASDMRCAAVRTLERLGYTWAGGELWRPPIGPRPDWAHAPPMSPDRFRAILEALAWSQRTAGHVLAGSERRGRRWASGAEPIPPEVARWLEEAAELFGRMPRIGGGEHGGK